MSFLSEDDFSFDLDAMDILGNDLLEEMDRMANYAPNGGMYWDTTDSGAIYINGQIEEVEIDEEEQSLMGNGQVVRAFFGYDFDMDTDVEQGEELLLDGHEFQVVDSEYYDVPPDVQMFEFYEEDHWAAEWGEVKWHAELEGEWEEFGNTSWYHTADGDIDYG